MSFTKWAKEIRIFYDYDISIFVSWKVYVFKECSNLVFSQFPCFSHVITCKFFSGFQISNNCFKSRLRICSSNSFKVSILHINDRISRSSAKIKKWACFFWIFLPCCIIECSFGIKSFLITSCLFFVFSSFIWTLLSFYLLYGLFDTFIELFFCFRSHSCFVECIKVLLRTELKVNSCLVHRVYLFVDASSQYCTSDKGNCTQCNCCSCHNMMTASVFTFFHNLCFFYKNKKACNAELFSFWIHDFYLLFKTVNLSSWILLIFRCSVQSF